MKWAWALLLFLCATCAADQQENQSFVRGSLQAIVAAHQGKPFILALWSLDCVHCREDLEMLGRLQAQYRNLDVVLVATDPLQRAAEIAPVFERYALQRAVSWIFADDFIERLRYEIDPEWYGELPRTYFFAADGKIIAQSGKFQFEPTALWVRQQVGN